MRRDHILSFGAALLFFTLACITYGCECYGSIGGYKPNIIVIFCDDLGYGDVGYMGNTIVKTPNLDEMAANGIRFSRFYSAAPVCSPTRASCLTGRHPYRTGITWAGRDALPEEEVTIAEVFKSNGYATGHFGKWHLGGLSKSVNQSEFPGGPSPYSPPWKNGFDECFSTESMMPLYNPYYHVGGKYGTPEYKHVQNVSVDLGQHTGGYPWSNVYWTGRLSHARSPLWASFFLNNSVLTVGMSRRCP